MSTLALEILNKWAEFSEYDPKRTTFNLNTYWLHRDNEVVGKLLSYDNTGALSVLYAKQVCKKLLSECHPGSYLSLIDDPSEYIESKEIWNSFNSENVKALEINFKNKINEIVDFVSEGKLLGEFKTEVSTEKLISFMTNSIKGLEKCKFDVFAKGPCSQHVQFNKKIYVFENCKECLQALNESQDAIYLCYIKLGDSSYGYFAFFVKDGSNIYSLSERIDEVYPGQHSSKRNHKDAENKQYDLFPYDFIFSFSEHDYKGYASKHKINGVDIDFFTLGADAYLPIIIAMYLIYKLYVGKVPEKKISYLYDLSVENRLSSVNGLIPLKLGTALAATYLHNPICDFDKHKFLSGEYSKEFKAREPDDTYLDYGYFSNDKQIFVDLFSEGFDERYLHLNNLYENNLLSSSQRENTYLSIDSMLSNEIIGSEKRIRMIHYYWVRKALAAHIVSKMDIELKEFGGKNQVRSWYENKMVSNIDYIYFLIVQLFGCSEEITLDSYKLLKQKFTVTYGCFPNDISNKTFIINQRHHKNNYKCLCPIDSSAVSFFFNFKPKGWKDVALILNMDENKLPKIIRGWENDPSYRGNSILDMIDPVEMIKHPLSRSYGMWNINENYYDFSFSLGFSKRGFISLCKKFDIDPVKFWGN